MDGSGQGELEEPFISDELLQPLEQLSQPFNELILPADEELPPPPPPKPQTRQSANRALRRPSVELRRQENELQQPAVELKEEETQPRRPYSFSYDAGRFPNHVDRTHR